MQKNDVFKCEDALVRVLAIDGEQILIIDCVKPTMPRWINADNLKEWSLCAEGEYPIPEAWKLQPEENIMTEQRKLMHERFTLQEDDRVHTTSHIPTPVLLKNIFYIGGSLWIRTPITPLKSCLRQPKPQS